MPGWIGDKPLAENLVKEGRFCRVHIKKTLEQQMGDLPKEKFDVPYQSFTHCVWIWLGHTW